MNIVYLFWNLTCVNAFEPPEEILKFRKGEKNENPHLFRSGGLSRYIAGYINPFRIWEGVPFIIGQIPLPYLIAVGLIRLVYRGSDFNAVALSYRNPLYYLRLYMFSLSGGLLFILIGLSSY